MLHKQNGALMACSIRLANEEHLLDSNQMWLEFEEGQAVAIARSLQPWRAEAAPAEGRQRRANPPNLWAIEHEAAANEQVAHLAAKQSKRRAGR